VTNMRQIIQKMGRVRTVIIITVISFLLAIMLDSLLAILLSHQFKQTEAIIRILIISIILVPAISWYLVGSFFDLEELEKDIKKLATYDELTGLLNRRVFYSSCEKLHSISVRNKQDYCILIVDMDGFKKINDTYGHASGDKVLSVFGQLSRETVRDSDVLARIGGEEFAFFLPNTNIEQAESLSHRLCEKVRKKAVISGNKYIQHTVSIGISINMCDNKQTLEQTLKMADEALCIAKNEGGNMIKTYSSE